MSGVPSDGVRGRIVVGGFVQKEQILGSGRKKVLLMARRVGHHSSLLGARRLKGEELMRSEFVRSGSGRGVGTSSMRVGGASPRGGFSQTEWSLVKGRNYVPLRRKRRGVQLFFLFVCHRIGF